LCRAGAAYLAQQGAAYKIKKKTKKKKKINSFNNKTRTYMPRKNIPKANEEKADKIWNPRTRRFVAKNGLSGCMVQLAEAQSKLNKLHVSPRQDDQPTAGHRLKLYELSIGEKILKSNIQVDAPIRTFRKYFQTTPTTKQITAFSKECAEASSAWKREQLPDKRLHLLTIDSSAAMLQEAIDKANNAQSTWSYDISYVLG
jgi:hypothetical protein